MDTNQTFKPVKKQKEKVFVGALGAFLFALGGGVMWFLLDQVGFLAGISGVVAVIAAVRGYTYFAKGRSVKGLVISVTMAVIVVVLAWYMCLVTDIYKAVAEWYEAGEVDFKLSYLAAFMSSYSFMKDPDIAISYLKDLAIGLLLCIGTSMFSIKSLLNELQREKSDEDDEEYEDEEEYEEDEEDEEYEEDEETEAPAEENA